jgi:hypothetical protein
MFRDIYGSIDLFCECPVNAQFAESFKRKAGLKSRPLFNNSEKRRSYVPQHVALPQRATPIFSLRPSSPTAPTTTCLPIT